MKLSHCFTFFLLLILCCKPAAANNSLFQSQGEPQVKSALIYQIAKHITWPYSDKKDFTVCLYGKDSLGQEMDKYANRQINDKPLRIIRGDITLDDKQCNILYFVERNRYWISRSKIEANKDHTLFISDAERFIDMGGMVGFKEMEGKVVIELNLQALSKVGLKVDPSLIEAAIRVIQ